MPVSSAEASLATDSVPYMGWNTYYGMGGVFDESTIKSVAESLISSGLRDAGYRIVWLDFGWTSGRDSSGRLTVKSSLWPDGMLGLTTSLHDNGFGCGYFRTSGKCLVTVGFQPNWVAVEVRETLGYRRIPGLVVF